jgi:hypothetical protein
MFESNNLRFLPQSSKIFENRPPSSRASSEALFWEEGSVDVAYRSHRNFKIIIT